MSNISGSTLFQSSFDINGNSLINSNKKNQQLSNLKGPTDANLLNKCQNTDRYGNQLTPINKTISSGFGIKGLAPNIETALCLIGKNSASNSDQNLGLLEKTIVESSRSSISSTGSSYSLSSSIKSYDSSPESIADNEPNRSSSLTSVEDISRQNSISSTTTSIHSPTKTESISSTSAPKKTSFKSRMTQSLRNFGLIPSLTVVTIKSGKFSQTAPAEERERPFTNLLLTALYSLFSGRRFLATEKPTSATLIMGDPDPQPNISFRQETINRPKDEQLNQSQNTNTPQEKPLDDNDVTVELVKGSDDMVVDWEELGKDIEPVPLPPRTSQPTSTEIPTQTRKNIPIGEEMQTQETTADISIQIKELEDELEEIKTCIQIRAELAEAKKEIKKLKTGNKMPQQEIDHYSSYFANVEKDLPFASQSDEDLKKMQKDFEECLIFVKGNQKSPESLQNGIGTFRERWDEDLKKKQSQNEMPKFTSILQEFQKTLTPSEKNQGKKKTTSPHIGFNTKTKTQVKRQANNPVKTGVKKVKILKNRSDHSKISKNIEQLKQKKRTLPLNKKANNIFSSTINMETTLRLISECLEERKFLAELKRDIEAEEKARAIKNTPENNNMLYELIEDELIIAEYEVSLPFASVSDEELQEIEKDIQDSLTSRMQDKKIKLLQGKIKNLKNAFTKKFKPASSPKKEIDSIQEKIKKLKSSFAKNFTPADTPGKENSLNGSNKVRPNLSHVGNRIGTPTNSESGIKKPTNFHTTVTPGKKIDLLQEKINKLKKTFVENFEHSDTPGSKDSLNGSKKVILLKKPIVKPTNQISSNAPKNINRNKKYNIPNRATSNSHQVGARVKTSPNNNRGINPQITNKKKRANSGKENSLSGSNKGMTNKGINERNRAIFFANYLKSKTRNQPKIIQLAKADKLNPRNQGKKANPKGKNPPQKKRWL